MNKLGAPKRKMTLLAALSKQINSTKDFKMILERLGRKYACEVCGIEKEEFLTRHHKIRRSIKKDNRITNLVCVCRDCHDVIEKFYDWIISFNAPMLWKAYKELLNKHCGISGMIFCISDIRNGFPPIQKMERYGIDETFYWDLNRREQIEFLKNLQLVIQNSYSVAEANLNRAVIKTIDFNRLYQYSVEYARSKKE